MYFNNLILSGTLFKDPVFYDKGDNKFHRLVLSAGPSNKKFLITIFCHGATNEHCNLLKEGDFIIVEGAVRVNYNKEQKKTDTIVNASKIQHTKKIDFEPSHNTNEETFDDLSDDIPF